MLSRHLYRQAKGSGNTLNFSPYIISYLVLTGDPECARDPCPVKGYQREPEPARDTRNRRYRRPDQIPGPLGAVTHCFQMIFFVIVENI